MVIIIFRYGVAGYIVHSELSPVLFILQMFFDVYLAAYLANPRTPSDIAQNRNPSFRRCFYNYFLESNGGTVAEHIRIFQLAFNNTYRYLRGLKAMERVVGGILQYALSEQCKMSLMRMTHCAQCAGYPNTTKTCSGFCLNTMRGCLLDLAGLVEPLESFSQALIAMKNRVSRNNPAQAITTIEADVFMMISTAGASSSITRAVSGQYKALHMLCTIVVGIIMYVIVQMHNFWLLSFFSSPVLHLIISNSLEVEIFGTISVQCFELTSQVDFIF